MSGRIHVYKVEKMRSGNPTNGRGGRTKDGEVEVRGRVSVASVRERFRAASFGVDLSAVAWAPLESDIAEKDRVIVDGVNRHVDGTYEIAAIDHQPVHLRLLLRRTRA